MKFFNSISVLSTRSQEPISLAEAAKLAEAKPKARSLDDILASTKTIKIAAAAATEKVVTASEANPSVQVKVAKMPAFIQEKIDAKKEKEGGDDKKKDKKDKKDNPFVKKEKDEEKDEKEVTASVKLQMTKDLDFRKLSAEKVMDSWKLAGGNMANCVASVKGKTNDPKTYCGLLQFASKTADRVIKVAAAEKAKTVKSATAKSPAFKKLAKLTESERSELLSYWTELYGPGYAKAMLEDY